MKLAKILVEENNELFFQPSKLELYINGESVETIELINIEADIEHICGKYDLDEYNLDIEDNLHFFI